MARFAGLWSVAGDGIANLTTTPVALTSWENAGDGPGCNATREGGRIIVKVPGYYAAFCMLSFIGATGDTYYAEFRVNGEVGSWFRSSVDGVDNATSHLALMGAALLHEGDVIQIYVYSDNAGGATFTHTDGQFGIFSL